MKKYIVRIVERATEKNKNFIGKVYEYYKGKGNKTIGKYGTFWDDYPVTEWQIKEYGYDSISDAKRNWSFNNLENDEWWDSKAEIIEVEV